MSPDDGMKSMNIIVSFHDRQGSLAELFTLDHMVNELLKNDANAIHQGPN